MNAELEKAVSFFCEMQPNLCDLHHPQDRSRLLKVIYLAFQCNEDVPLDSIKEKLSNKTPSELHGGTIVSFMKSCEEYVHSAMDILEDAKRAEIIK